MKARYSQNAGARPINAAATPVSAQPNASVISRFLNPPHQAISPPPMSEPTKNTTSLSIMLNSTSGSA